jgi:two-component system, NarL family, sensor histidine kinase UhpB
VRVVADSLPLERMTAGSHSDVGDGRASYRAGMTLQWRVFATNAAVLVVATLVLVLTPLTVSFPIALAELVALVGGLAAMLALNLVLLRRAFGPLGRLTVVMRGVDPLRPGERAAIEAADPEVAELTAAFNDMLGRLEAERRDSARRALAAQEHERRRIARELHDEIGQALTAVVLQLDHVRRGESAGMRDEVAQAREAVRSSLEEVRGIAGRLRPEALDDLGLSSALAALTNDMTRRTRLPVERSIAPGLPPLAPDEELVIYRVAQEALTNVVRHAAAHRADLVLSVRDGCVELVVRDDGDGFDPRSAIEGAGLLGMRERAVLIGAALDVTGGAGQGTSVRLRLAPR